MTKYCHACNRDRDHSEFQKHSGMKDGLQPHCRECRSAHAKKKYQEDPEYLNKRTRKFWEARMARISAIKASTGCIACPENEPCCLDFHHLNGKDFNITERSRYHKWDRILDEISRCCVLCANCHGEVHVGLLNLEDVKPINIDEFRSEAV